MDTVRLYRRQTSLLAFPIGEMYPTRQHLHGDEVNIVTLSYSIVWTSAGRVVLLLVNKLGALESGQSKGPV